MDAAGLPAAAALDEGREASVGSAVRLGAEAAARLLSLATTLLIARSLGPAEFGVFAACLAVAALASEAGDLGLQTTASRALVDGSLPLRGLLRAKLALSVLLCLAAALLGALHPVLAPLVLWVSLARWGEFFGVALRARGRRGREAAVLVCLRAAALAAVLLALQRGAGLVVLAWGLAGSSLLALGLGGALVARAWRSAPEEGAAGRGVAPSLRESLPLGVNGVLALLGLRVELLALVLLRSEAEAGVFAAALKVVEFLVLVPSAIAAGAMPALTRDAARGASTARNRTAATAACLGVPAALGLALLAPSLVPLVFGAAFGGGAGPLRLLALALAPMFVNAALMHALVAAGQARLLPRLTAVRVTTALVLALPLVTAFGPSGGAAGFLVSEGVLLVLVSRAASRLSFPVPVASLLLRAAGASLPMLAVVALCQAGPVLAALLGAAVYGLTLGVLLRFRPAFRRPSAAARLGYP